MTPLDVGQSESREDVVHDLARELEDGTYLGTCDWGSCGNQQAGWARCTCDACAAAGEAWLAICDPCRKRGDTKDRGVSHPVAEFISFAAAWREAHNEPLEHAARRAALAVLNDESTTEAAA